MSLGSAIAVWLSMEEAITVLLSVRGAIAVFCEDGESAIAEMNFEK